MCEIGNKNRLEKQYMPSEAFHRTPDGRIKEIIAEVRFGLGNLESFNPVTQDTDRLQPAANQITTKSWTLLHQRQNEELQTEPSENQTGALKLSGR
jgi:hypothetical protein